MEFFHWLTLYFNVVANVYGEERAELLKVYNDDEGFDRWLAEYHKKHNSGGEQKSAMTQEDYLKKYGRIHGGEL